MDINCEYYKVFYYVAKYGNVSQAARYMTGSQPNLTRMIKNLEGQLGCPLFLRTSHGMRLTPEGERLYKHIRVAFEHIEAGEAEICESRSLESGSVFVAASEVALRCLLLPVLKKYRLPDENRDYALIIIEKISATPEMYPRHNSKIERSPL